MDAIPIFCGHTIINKDRPVYLPDPQKFDDLKDLLSATINMLPNVKDLSKDKALVVAERHWIKWIQDKHYADVYEFLKKLKGNNLRSLEGKKIVRSTKLTVPSLCLNLHLCLDKDDIIRIKTSISNCPNLTYEQKYPILLPAKESFTKLVIFYNHVLSGHMGLHYTRSQLRHKFWIPKDTSVIKSVVNKCNSCNIERGQRYHVPDSPDLSTYRFDVQHPWKASLQEWELPKK